MAAVGGQNLFKFRADVPVKDCSRDKSFGPFADDGVATADVAAEAGYALAAYEGEAVAVSELGLAAQRNFYRIFSGGLYGYHLSDALSHAFGRIRGGPVPAPAAYEQFGIGPVEGLVHVGSK